MTTVTVLRPAFDYVVAYGRLHTLVLAHLDGMVGLEEFAAQVREIDSELNEAEGQTQ